MNDRDIVRQLEEGHARRVEETTRHEPTGRCGAPHPKLRQPWGTPATCTRETDHGGKHRTVHLSYHSNLHLSYHSNLYQRTHSSEAAEVEWSDEPS